MQPEQKPEQTHTADASNTVAEPILTGQEASNPTPQPNSHQPRKRLITLIIGVVLLAVITTGGYLAFKHFTADKYGATDTTTGIQYTTIREGLEGRYFSPDLGSSGIDVTGIQVYKPVRATLPTSLTTLPSRCSFTVSEFAEFNGGMLLLKNFLKDAGLKYSSLEDIEKAYAKDSQTSIKTIEGTKILRIDDSGNGFREYCTVNGKQYEKKLDVGITYVAITENNDELFLTLTKPTSTINGTSVDQKAADSASNVLTEEDLETQMAYILSHNE